jgi:Transposase DDE domain group 1
MATDCIAQLTFRYQGLRPPIVARFDMPYASSDGGLVLLKAVDERLRLTETVAAGLRDCRQPGKVAHSILDLVRQRVFGLAAGYLDGNDAARLAADPLHKLVLDREPLSGRALSSPPTLSRFENGVRRRDLVRVGQGLARTGIAETPLPPPRPSSADHDRSGPDRRSDARPARAEFLQRPLRHRVLSAARGDADVRRRAAPEPGRHRPCDRAMPWPLPV